MIGKMLHSWRFRRKFDLKGFFWLFEIRTQPANSAAIAQKNLLNFILYISSLPSLSFFLKVRHIVKYCINIHFLSQQDNRDEDPKYAEVEIVSTPEDALKRPDYEGESMREYVWKSFVFHLLLLIHSKKSKSI